MASFDNEPAPGMTPAELRKLLDAIPSAPWHREWNNEDDQEDGVDIYCNAVGSRLALIEGGRDLNPVAIADAIIALRNHADALLRVAEAAEELWKQRQEAESLDDVAYDANDTRIEEAGETLFAALAALREVKP